VYLGLYTAIVADTKDPLKKKRIRVKCPEVLGGQLSNWASPCLPPKYSTLPSKGDLVWIQFAGGRIDSPVWMGVLEGA